MGGKHKGGPKKHAKEAARWTASAAPAAEPAVSRKSAFQCPRCNKTVAVLSDLDTHNNQAHLDN
jgi:transcription elongation factor Elf1